MLSAIIVLLLWLLRPSKAADVVLAFDTSIWTHPRLIVDPEVSAERPLCVGFINGEGYQGRRGAGA